MTPDAPEMTIMQDPKNVTRSLLVNARISIKVENEVDDCSIVYCSSAENKNNDSSNTSSKPPIRCNMCGKTFAIYSHLYRHTRDVHGSYRCFVCGQQLPKYEELVLHMKSHHPSRFITSEPPQANMPPYAGYSPANGTQSAGSLSNLPHNQPNPAIYATHSNTTGLTRIPSQTSLTSPNVTTRFNPPHRQTVYQNSNYRPNFPQQPKFAPQPTPSSRLRFPAQQTLQHNDSLPSRAHAGYAANQTNIFHHRLPASTSISVTTVPSTSGPKTFQPSAISSNTSNLPSQRSGVTKQATQNASPVTHGRQNSSSPSINALNSFLTNTFPTSESSNRQRYYDMRGPTQNTPVQGYSVKQEPDKCNSYPTISGEPYSITPQMFNGSYEQNSSPQTQRMNNVTVTNVRPTEIHKRTNLNTPTTEIRKHNLITNLNTPTQQQQPPPVQNTYSRHNTSAALPKQTTIQPVSNSFSLASFKLPADTITVSTFKLPVDTVIEIDLTQNSSTSPASTNPTEASTHRRQNSEIPSRNSSRNPTLTAGTASTFTTSEKPPAFVMMPAFDSPPASPAPISAPNTNQSSTKASSSNYKRFCESCGITFSTRSNFRKHMWDVRPQSTVPCQICSRTFPGNCALNFHMQFHDSGTTSTLISINIPEASAASTSSNEILTPQNPPFIQVMDIICKTCARQFTSKSTFVRHYRNFHEKVNIACPTCAKKYTRRCALNLHMKYCNSGKHSVVPPISETSNKTDDEIVFIGQLRSKGPENQDPQVQNADISSTSSIPAQQLSSVIPSETGDFSQNLYNQLPLNNQQESGLFSCLVCPNKYKRVFELDKHVKLCHPEVSKEMPKTGETKTVGEKESRNSDTESVLTRNDESDSARDASEPNAETENSSSDQELECKGCGKKYSNPGSLQNHMLACSMRFKCEICGSVFKKRKLLLQHFAKLHDKSKKCEKCNKVLPNFKSLHQHMRRMHETRKHKCKFCHKTYFDKHKLKAHLYSHTGEKPFQCTICKKRYGSTAGLKLHIATHDSNTSHLCDICGKVLASQSSLSTHKKTHGSKSFICEICEKGFKSNARLKLHLTVHTGEQPHTCKYCYKKFARYSNYTLHLRIHTKTCPYSCKICGKKFYNASNCKTHMKSH